MDNFRGNKNYGEKKYDKRGGNSGGNRDRKSFGGGRNDSRPDMHSAVCSECGKNCEVPFRPTGSKPIYCSDCFRDKGPQNNTRDRGRESNDRGRDSKPRFESKKPYQSDRAKETFNYKAQFEMLANKLDRIIDLLASKDNNKKTETPIAEVSRTEDLPKKVHTKKHNKKVNSDKKVDAKALKQAIGKSLNKDIKVKEVKEVELKAKKEVAKKPVIKKTVAKKAVVKKAVVKKTIAKKPVAKKTVTKKAVAKKTTKK